MATSISKACIIYLHSMYIEGLWSSQAAALQVDYSGFSRKIYNFLNGSTIFHNYIHTTTYYENEQPTYPCAGDKIQEVQGLLDDNVALFGIQVSVKLVRYVCDIRT